MQEQEETTLNPRAEFLIKPKRIGRDKEVEPFTIGFGDHHRDTAEVLAHRIFRHVQPMLISREFEVQVNLAKGKFWIEGGRYGEGNITRIE